MPIKERIEIIVRRYKNAGELAESDREVLEAAMEAGKSAYARYSGFHVGAALRLDDGNIVKGNNRENAAFPAGICAERTAIAWAGANYPDTKIETIAVCAMTEGKFTDEPVSPCGICRQVMAEEEDRSENKIRLIMYGRSGIAIVEGISNLLPLHFSSRVLGL